MAGLADVLVRRIALGGPLTVAQYMTEALGHPRHGYYATRDPLGAAGDFVTAPEISQMFGELIGLWCAVVWQAMDRPDPFCWVELGPGRGTLMADALRAAEGVPGFVEAARIHLVETSPLLRTRQADALADAGAAVPPAWHDDVAAVPPGPMLLIANEFFDALPIRQFQRTDAGWCERLVGTDGAGPALRWVLSPPAPRPPLLAEAVLDAPVGAIAEVSPAAIGVADVIGHHLAEAGGAALIIDYGHSRSAVGDTLQAVRGHAYHDVLDEPGEADLTAHVDFAVLLRAGAEAGARPFGPIEQGTFLGRLGLGVRAEALKARATPTQAAAIDTARHRLVAPEAMGCLFKAAVLQDRRLPPPPGFA